MGHYKIWLCRCGFSPCATTRASPPPLAPLNDPWCSSRGQTALRPEGQQTWPTTSIHVTLFQPSAVLFSSICSFCPSASYFQFSLLLFFDWTRGGGGWALRRGSRRHWARISPLLPFSHTLLHSNRRRPAFLPSLASHHELVAAVQNQLLWPRAEVRLPPVASRGLAR